MLGNVCMRVTITVKVSITLNSGEHSDTVRSF